MSSLSQNSDTWPATLPGFDHILRMWDATQNLCASKILPGEYYVTCHDEIITTVLGSCVSACIRDPDTGVGGMNHFMLPGTSSRRTDQRGDDCLATRYGIAAMETLVNDILKHGACKERLELKLFGGGQVLPMEVNNIGECNVEFARQFARAEGLEVMAEDLGETYPRKVHYFPKTGKVMVRRLRALQNQAIVAQEKKYGATLGKQEIPGEIDLFD